MRPHIRNVWQPVLRRDRQPDACLRPAFRRERRPRELDERDVLDRRPVPPERGDGALPERADVVHGREAVRRARRDEVVCGGVRDGLQRRARTGGRGGARAELGDLGAQVEMRERAVLERAERDLVLSLDLARVQVRRDVEVTGPVAALGAFAGGECKDRDEVGRADGERADLGAGRDVP